jgi:hypothetical protein
MKEPTEKRKKDETMKQPTVKEPSRKSGRPWKMVDKSRICQHCEKDVGQYATDVQKAMAGNVIYLSCIIWLIT